MTVGKRKGRKNWGYDFTDIFGNRHQKYVYKTKEEAKRAEAEAITLANKGVLPKNNDIKFVDLCDNYMELYVKVSLREATFINYDNQLNNHIKPYFNQIKARDITPEIVSAFVKSKQNSGLSAKSINHFITTIKAILFYGVDNKYLQFNPADRAKKLPLPHTERTIFTVNEVKALLEKTKEKFPDFYPLLYTAICTGMRRGEILGLQWECVCWSTKIIKIKRSLFNKKLGEPKTSSSVRDIMVSEDLISVLKEWKKKCPKSEMDLVFPNKNGEPMDANNMVKRYYKESIKASNVTDISFHDLRHTYTSILLSKRMPLEMIQRQLGHANCHITMDTYAHVMEETQEASRTIIESLNL